MQLSFGAKSLGRDIISLLPINFKFASSISNSVGWLIICSFDLILVVPLLPYTWCLMAL